MNLKLFRDSLVGLCVGFGCAPGTLAQTPVNEPVVAEATATNEAADARDYVRELQKRADQDARADGGLWGKDASRYSCLISVRASPSR